MENIHVYIQYVSFTFSANCCTFKVYVCTLKQQFCLFFHPLTTRIFHFPQQLTFSFSHFYLTANYLGITNAESTKSFTGHLITNKFKSLEPLCSYLTLILELFPNFSRSLSWQVITTLKFPHSHFRLSALCTPYLSKSRFYNTSDQSVVFGPNMSNT